MWKFPLSCGVGADYISEAQIYATLGIRITARINSNTPATAEAIAEYTTPTVRHARLTAAL